MTERNEISLSEGKSGKINAQGNVLEVTVRNSPFQETDSSIVDIESPNHPGVRVETVDHRKFTGAPSEAIYRITAYIPSGKSNDLGNALNGDVLQIYVGPKGIILR